MNADLSWLKHLSFEIGPDCNLAEQHQFCPVNRTRNLPGRRITPDDVVRVTDQAVALGFVGYVGFHYYNEPLLYPDFIREVARRSTHTRRVLWTNGRRLSQLPQENDILSLFEWVFVTDYDGTRGGEWTQRHQEFYPQVRFEVRLVPNDDRLANTPPPGAEPSLDQQCLRHRLEVAIDCRGEVHLCCQDWSLSFPMGNILDESLADILERNEEVRMNLERGSGPTPAVCGICRNHVLRGGW